MFSDVAVSSRSPEIDALRENLPGSPLILGPDQHSISNRKIDPDCVKVVGRLNRAGYQAFLVGGSVRDMLLGKEPKDVDLSTNARPEEIRKLFRNCRIIGKRFKLVHVYFHGNKIFELSTFRAATVTPPDDAELGDFGDWDGIADEDIATLAADNTYGDARSDALRRDITINGLFYDVETRSVVDYVGGMEDLQRGIVRIIGDPRVRFKEDPVRMVRVLRHAARAGFTIEDATYAAIVELRQLIEIVPHVRIFEELCKDLRGGSARDVVELFNHTGILPYLIPLLAKQLTVTPEQTWEQLERTLVSIDKIIQSGKEIPSSVLFLGLMLGAVPPEFFVEDDIEPVREFWSAVPITAAQGADGSVVWKPSEWVTDVQPAQIRELLEDSVDKLMCPIGVYRKDREQMEKILRKRMELLLAYARQKTESVDLSRGPIAETLQLLELSSHDDICRGAFLYWQERYSDPSNIQKSRSDKPRKRQRGRRRGRKPQTR